MSSVNERIVEDGVFEDVKPACVALVPLAHELTPEITWARKLPLPRPDPSFVTQLIATAEQVPQTRVLRRASTADALSAYDTHVVREAGLRTRQVI